jgi:transposase
VAFHLTGGEVSDTTQLQSSLDIGPDITPRVAITDKGYDSAANRAACRSRGIIPVIRHRENAKHRPRFFPRLLYKTRARVEQTIRKLKRFKRIAMRCVTKPQIATELSLSPAHLSWSNPSTGLSQTIPKNPGSKWAGSEGPSGQDCND